MCQAYGGNERHTHYKRVNLTINDRSVAYCTYLSGDVTALPRVTMILVEFATLPSHDHSNWMHGIRSMGVSTKR